MAVSATIAAITTAAGVATGAVAFTFAAIATSFLVSTAMGAALNALTPKPKLGGGVAGQQGYSLSGQSGSALDHQIIYGEARVGGVRVYDASTGGNNEFLHRILAFAGHEVDSYQEIYLNDEVVTIDGSGNVTSPSQYSGFVRIKTYLGTTTQTADPDLVSETSGLADGAWTNSHRLQNIAYVYVRFKYSQDAFPNGVPALSVKIRGKKVFDPRTSTTAWSSNPALCIRDYLTSDYGLGQVSGRIDDTLVSAAANICDQTVESENRYTCNGAFITGQSPSDILTNLLTSMGGLLWYGQGKWRIKASSWTAPSVSFDEDDLRSGISLSTRHSRRDNFNSVKGTFAGDATDWQPTDYPEVTDPAFLVADNNLPNVLDFPLPFTSSSLTAQRVARIALNRNREQLTFSASFGMRAFQVQVGDFVNITNSRFGWTNKAFEVTQWTFGLTDGLDIQVNMTLREISEGVFTSVNGAEFELNNTTLPNPFLSVNVGLSLSTELRVANEQVVGALIIDVTSDNPFVERFEVQFKRSNETDYIMLGQSRGNRFEAIGVSDGLFDVRARAISQLGVRGPFNTIEGFYATLFETPPETVTNFAANVVGNTLHLTWTPVGDLDLSHYKVRYSPLTTGASYQNAVDVVEKISRPANSITLPSKQGTYFIKAVDKLGNPSEAATSVVVQTNTADIDALNVVQTLTEHPDFTGDKTSVVRLVDEAGPYLTLDTSVLFDSVTGDFDDATGLFDGGGGGAVASSGVYQFANYVDLGQKYVSRVQANVRVSFLDYANSFDAAAGLFDDREGNFDGDEAQFDTTTVKTQVSLTDDDPAGSPTWSDWQDFFVGDVAARALRFRAVLATSDDNNTPAVRELSVEVDMPDRVEADDDITYTGSQVVNFPTAFKVTPAIGIAASLADGDRYEISGKSRTGFTITTYTGGSISSNPTTIDYVAKGYGKELAV